MHFTTSMDAKEFLVSRIVDEAYRRHDGLSELEQKMLYFSERYPTLPDMMETAQQFEAEYDDQKYEKKIRRLSRKAFERDRKESRENVPLWREAIKLLKQEDHYILVMLDVPRSPADLVKRVLTIVVAAVVLLGAIWAINSAGRNVLSRIPDSIKLLVFVLLCVLAYYLTFSNEGTKVGDSLGKLIERVARWF